MSTAIALAYHQSGLCVLPVAPDGSKRPAVGKWEGYKTERPTPDDLARWFTSCDGYGLVCGAISGGLEVIDFDEPALFAPWSQSVDPGLLARLPSDETPRGGRHVYYRCAAIEGNRKLARDKSGQTTIETRGEGGFIVVPPTSARYHPAGKPYAMTNGDLAAIPTITAEERASLLDAALALNQHEARKFTAPSNGNGNGANAGTRPGDEYGAKVTWADILEPRGWHKLYCKGDTTFWQRPGKTGPGASATTGHNGKDNLYVFTSNAAPFEPETCYTKFAAYTLLEHSGDWRSATRALVGMGYGVPETVTPITEGVNELQDRPIVKAVEPEPGSWATIAEALSQVRWLWPQWLAQGFLHLVVGESGKGKSSVLLRLAGTFTEGWDWPDGTPFVGERCSILWAEAESAQALNVARQIAWGMSASRILTPFPNALQDWDVNRPDHRRALEVAARRPDVGLVIVDSLSGACGGKCDENSTDMLRLVKWLATLARNLQKPVVVSHHLRKKGLIDGTGTEVTLDRIRGSSAITQMCRLAWAIDAPDKREPDKLRLSVIKSNLAKFPTPLGLVIDEGGIVFGGVALTARLTDAQRAIYDDLKDNGESSASAVAMRLDRQRNHVSTDLNAMAAKNVIGSRREGLDVLYIIKDPPIYTGLSGHTGQSGLGGHTGQTSHIPVQCVQCPGEGMVLNHILPTLQFDRSYSQVEANESLANAGLDLVPGDPYENEDLPRPVEPSWLLTDESEASE